MQRHSLPSAAAALSLAVAVAAAAATAARLQVGGGDQRCQDLRGRTGRRHAEHSTMLPHARHPSLPRRMRSAQTLPHPGCVLRKGCSFMHNSQPPAAETMRGCMRTCSGCAGSTASSSSGTNVRPGWEMSTASAARGPASPSPGCCCRRSSTWVGVGVGGWLGGG